MADPPQVIDAANQFVEESTNGAAFVPHIIRTAGEVGLEGTHKRAVEKAAGAARAVDAALAVLFAAAKAWGYDPNPLTDYQAHPNDQTRGASIALALRLLTRAEAERDVSEAPTEPSASLMAVTATTAAGNVLPSIRTLPLPGEGKELFSRATTRVN